MNGSNPGCKQIQSSAKISEQKQWNCALARSPNKIVEPDETTFILFHLFIFLCVCCMNDGRALAGYR